jgi:hypothetical protein|tara:strand:+ start:23556 stop:23807 length:252 start_codon:yes stop_codon:yes gene_type:complete
MIVYPQALETDLTTATTVQDALYVSVINTGTVALITIRANPDTADNRRSITLDAGERAVIRKERTDTLEGGVAFKAVPVIRQQ